MEAGRPLRLDIVRDFMREDVRAELDEAYRLVHRQPALRGLGLTTRQRQLLDWIEKYQSEHDATPSFDDMREAMGLASKSGIHRLVSALVERGLLTRKPRRARSIAVVGRRA